MPTIDAPAGRAPRDWAGPKPRLVFFRFADPTLPDFIAGHLRDHVRCLEQWFDVHVIDRDADYDEVVDRLQPDLALFESGVYARRGRAIANTHRHPGIPKLGLLNADGYCPTRSVFLADMDDWGVETFFTIATSASGYTPDIADRTFVWPNFADRRIFHPYPGGKSRSILLSGSRETNYPWRVRVDGALRERFPVTTMQHSGWFDREAAAAMPAGEAYARTLSAALIVPTCGTIAEELVRKHLEIPASGALLLTERTPVVEAAGFVDMVSCVFADASDAADKVAYLLEHPDELAEIAAAGTRLAHERHSIEHRDQIRQWYELHRGAPGARIVQPDLFGSLAHDPLSGARPVSAVARPGVDRRLLRSGDALLEAGLPARAADRFAQVLNLHFEPEAALGLARSAVRLGRPPLASALLEHSAAIVVRTHGASHPDPVEQAWQSRVALCGADLRAAVEHAAAHPGVRHPELDRMRAVIRALGGTAPEPADRPRHRSVHSGFGAEPWDEWQRALVDDLAACGRDETAARVAAMPDPTRATAQSVGARAGRTSASRGRGAAAAARHLLARARRRATREAAALLGRDAPPDRASLFQVLEGRPIDAVLLLMVDDGIARRIEALGSRDPWPLEIVRLGRAVSGPARDGFVPWGHRSGVERAVLRSVPSWGTSMVVTTRAGMGHLELADLASTRIVVVVPGGAPETDAERRLRARDDWSPASEALATRLRAVLPAAEAAVWERRPARDDRARVPVRVGDLAVER
ncbi:glycosyltransferase family protein [Agrococcus carbonis]|uniref:Glycosyl transferases group 1 n=1 Tax=Agrococcus carbonis TaxID=684552 RepID=A0A1H1LCI7_9MICO|nr:glycosyltransferase [Agrococcus carbonis]SDR72258.1 Glycosyl transferases group 1 [Agrococcus carbonis]